MEIDIHLFDLKRLIFIFALAIGLAGCSQNVAVEAEFPEPLIEPLPLKAAVYYSAELTGFTYTEELPESPEWSISLGEANTRLFDRVFSALFKEIVAVSALPTPGSPLGNSDLVISPEVDALEFSLPNLSKDDEYAVWIRYNLRIYTPDGKLVNKWPVTAYGESDANMLSPDDSMRRAAELAMRDAAAKIVIEMPEQNGVRELVGGEEQTSDSS